MPGSRQTRTDMVVAARIEASSVSERSVGMVNMVNPNRCGVALRELGRQRVGLGSDWSRRNRYEVKREDYAHH